MIENIRLSFQGIWSHKMRSFLTMLGIIIGIASIISIVSTIKGTNEQIKKNLIGSGTNTVQIQLYQGDYQYEMLYNGLPDGIPVRDETTMEKIKSVKNVEDAAFYTSRSDYNNSVYYGNNGISGSQVFGVDNSYFTTNGLVLKSGRTLWTVILRISTRQPSSMPIRRIRCLTAKTPSEKRSRSAAFRLRWLAL